MSAKGIFEQVIARGGFDLTAMLARIDEYHISGKLDDGERDALYAAARAHAHPQYDYDAEIEALWAAIRALREAIAPEPASLRTNGPRLCSRPARTTLTMWATKSRSTGSGTFANSPTATGRRTRIRRGGRCRKKASTLKRFSNKDRGIKTWQLLLAARE